MGEGWGAICKVAKIEDVFLIWNIFFRKRFVYSFNCEDHPPSINSPMIEDYTGINFRREGLGGSFIVGAAPHPDFTPPSESEEDKLKFFNDMVLPCLSRRVPSFKDVKVKYIL